MGVSLHHVSDHRERSPDPRCPGQYTLFKLGQLDDPFHTLKTVKGLLDLVPSRTPRSSGYGVLYTFVYVNVIGLGFLGLGYMLFNPHLCNHIILLQSGGGT